MRAPFTFAAPSLSSGMRRRLSASERRDRPNSRSAPSLRIFHKCVPTPDAASGADSTPPLPRHRAPKHPRRHNAASQLHKTNFHPTFITLSDGVRKPNK